MQGPRDDIDWSDDEEEPTQQVKISEAAGRAAAKKRPKLVSLASAKKGEIAQYLKGLTQKSSCTVLIFSRGTSRLFARRYQQRMQDEMRQASRSTRGQPRLGTLESPSETGETLSQASARDIDLNEEGAADMIPTFSVITDENLLVGDVLRRQYGCAPRTARQANRDMWPSRREYMPAMMILTSNRRVLYFWAGSNPVASRIAPRDLLNVCTEYVDDPDDERDSANPAHLTCAFVRFACSVNCARMTVDPNLVDDESDG